MNDNAGPDHPARPRGRVDDAPANGFRISGDGGNGIELYRDRAEADWPRTADGTLAMTPGPLDLGALLSAH